MDTVFVSITAKCPTCEKRIQILPIIIGKTVICDVCDSEFKVDFPKSKSVRNNEKNASSLTSRNNKISVKKETIRSEKKITSNTVTDYENPSEFRMRGRPSPQTIQNNSSSKVDNTHFNHPSPQKNTSNMPFAVAMKNVVQCPKCKYGFNITSEFYGAIGVCNDCNCEFLVMPPEIFNKPGKERDRSESKTDTAPSDITISNSPPKIDETDISHSPAIPSPTVDKNKTTHFKHPSPKKDTSNIPFAFATENEVRCPKCKFRFMITPEFYGAIGVCEDCNCEFLVIPPKIFSNSPNSSEVKNIVAPLIEEKSEISPIDVTSSGIEIDDDPPEFGLTGTLKMNQNMGMEPRRHIRKENTKTPKSVKKERTPIQEDSHLYVVAKNRHVECPKCLTEFNISPKLYNTNRACPKCSCKFIIKPPGTPPYNKLSQNKAAASSNENFDSQQKRHPPMTEILPGNEDIKRNRKPNLECEHLPSTRNTTNMLSAMATEENDIGCPQCEYRFKIRPEFYGAVGVCQTCDCEFLVLPPESSYNLK